MMDVSEELAQAEVAGLRRELNALKAAFEQLHNEAHNLQGHGIKATWPILSTDESRRGRTQVYDVLIDGALGVETFYVQ